jgi:hypothetical protein
MVPASRLTWVLWHLLRAKAGKPVALPDGTTALVICTEPFWQAVDVWVQVGDQRAGLQDLAQAARRLMEADDPPSASASCFSTRNEVDEPPAFLRRHQPPVSTNPAPVSTWRPAPVKPAAPPQRPKAKSQTVQLNLF